MRPLEQCEVNGRRQPGPGEYAVHEYDPSICSLHGPKFATAARKGEFDVDPKTREQPGRHVRCDDA